MAGGLQKWGTGEGSQPFPHPTQDLGGQSQVGLDRWPGTECRGQPGARALQLCAPVLSRSTQPRAASLPGGPSRILSVKIQPQCVETSSVCTNRKPRCVTHYPNTSSALSTPVLRDFRERKAPEGQGPSLIIPFPSLWPKCLANRWRDTFRKNEHKHDHVGICRRLCKAH